MYRIHVSGSCEQNCMVLILQCGGDWDKNVSVVPLCRWDFTVKQEDINQVLEDFGGDLSLPENFEKTAPIHNPSEPRKKCAQSSLLMNPQTTLLCTMLDITGSYTATLRHIKLTCNLLIEMIQKQSQLKHTFLYFNISKMYYSLCNRRLLGMLSLSLLKEIWFLL